MVYTPAVSPVAVAVVCPEGFHWYVYGETPPPAITVALPVPPLHKILLPAFIVAVNLAGCVIVTAEVEEHPLPSVTVIV